VGHAGKKWHSEGLIFLEFFQLSRLDVVLIVRRAVSLVDSYVNMNRDEFELVAFAVYGIGIWYAATAHKSRNNIPQHQKRIQRILPSPSAVPHNLTSTHRKSTT